MGAIVLSFIVFSIMLLFPILFSLLVLQRSQGQALEVNQSKVRDPRFFAKSFTSLFDQKWADYDGSGTIFLSRKEGIIEADKLTEYPPFCQSIIYAENQDFHPNAGTSFEKEIYACQDAYLFGTKAVRAICCKKNLFLGAQTQILRWADAEGTLTISDHCDLGISASSATRIIIGKDCRFRRLYAPTIIFGQASEEDIQVIESGWSDLGLDSAALPKFRNVKYVDADLTDDSGTLPGSVNTREDLVVLDELAVQGHIRSQKSIRLCDRVVVYGNLFAEGDIFLGQNSRVYGSVFTQGSLYAETGVSIGQPGKIKSVIARGEVRFEDNCRVHGYVSSEIGGRCCPEFSPEHNYQAGEPTFSFSKYIQLGAAERYRSAIAALFLIAALGTVGISATALKGQIEMQKALVEAKETHVQISAYGVDGKASGSELATKPSLITTNHIYFEDRVLERFQYDSQDLVRGSEVIRGLMNTLPKGVNKYLMLVPLRISFEGEPYHQYSPDSISAIKEIHSRMPGDVINLNVSSILREHADEYLFFRTDHGWTALGAYYAAQEFSRKAGVSMKDISAYSEYRFEHHFGPLTALPDAQGFDMPPDYVSYYLLQHQTNKQTITAYRGNEYKTYSSPTVAVSRLGYDIFLGAYFSHSLLQGDGKNEKTLMILGDEFSKPFAPWLTPYYQNVIVINPNFFRGGSGEFKRFFSEYQVTDFLLLESIQSIGSSKTNHKISQIYSGV